MDKGKPAARRKRADDSRLSQWDHLQGCKHDLYEGNRCPLCLLVEQSTRKFLAEEKINLAKARAESVIARTRMRHALLKNWSRCQLSMYPECNIGIGVELSLNGPLLDALLSSDEAVSTEGLVHILRRRKNIMEVGQYAATFLQCRIRKFLCRQRVRRFLLKRFEFVPAERYRGEFYIDKHTSRKWMRQPQMLHGERPGTPRAITRRLAAQDKKYSDRELSMMQLGRKLGTVLSLKAIPAGAKPAQTRSLIWQRESERVTQLLQLLVLSDVLLIAMHMLLEQHIEDASKKVLPSSPTRASMPPTPSTRRSILKRLGSSTTDMSSLMNSISAAVNAAEAPRCSVDLGSEGGGSEGGSVTSAYDLIDAAETKDAEDALLEKIPLIWLCLSAPAPCARSLGLALALDRFPALEEMGGGGGVGGNSPAMGKARAMSMSANNPIPPPPPTDVSASVAGEITAQSTANERLVHLEQLAWEALRCRSVDDMLSILQNEELHPGYVSALNLSDDELHLWNTNVSVGSDGKDETSGEMELGRKGTKAEKARSEKIKAMMASLNMDQLGGLRVKELSKALAGQPTGVGVDAKRTKKCAAVSTDATDKDEQSTSAGAASLPKERPLDSTGRAIHEELDVIPMRIILRPIMCRTT